MNICILGGTGRVGKIIVENALHSGHRVRSLVRDTSRLSTNKQLTVLKGDVLNKADIINSMDGCDAVFSALNTDGNGTLSKSIPYIIEGMQHHGIKRIITIGTAGILQARTEPEKYRFLSNESRRKSTTAAEDHLQVYLQLKESNLDWTIVCPTYLPVGTRKGQYRVDIHMLPENSSSISVYDTADFAFLQLSSTDFLNCRVGITY
ncbi:NAD(P)H-binding protein [Cytobacillus spongiae]|jgi:putative NADH-flavin reductase|uniref:NAD(P)-dependent oxidoreductase n=1 Tax=Cytobacillus spongiae TaxID=2901381 RepID=UPI001F23A7FD|nr:NAD(P)H-binding protein [Cytobacillus spongiae]UII56846.1 NAD(P)H-binding protein [Cytobacillus spongiae]